MKTVLKLCLAALFTSVGAFAMPPQDGDHSPAQIAKNIEIEISQHLPKRLNETTTFQNIKAFGEKLTYYYELNDVSSVEFSKFSWQKIDEIKKTSHESVMRAACGGEDTRSMIDAGVMMEYRYTLKNGKFFYQFSVSKADCERNKF